MTEGIYDITTRLPEPEMPLDEALALAAQIQTELDK
jgi:hypothetical protein